MLEQADGTGWMALYCLSMLEIALVLAEHDPAYEDVAVKFFEHYAMIVAAINDRGLWDESDGFYYDQVRRVSDGDRVAGPRAVDDRADAAVRGRQHRAGARSPALAGVLAPGAGLPARAPGVRRGVPAGDRSRAMVTLLRSSVPTACRACCSGSPTRASSSRRTGSARCRPPTAASRSSSGRTAT